MLARIWPDREPTGYRCATVGGDEVQQLRRIRQVVRMGRVQSIDASRIVLDAGEIPTGPDVLHVDCTACGLPTWAPRPVFEPTRITLQSVLYCQPSASAALVAAAEVSLPDDATRNRSLQAVMPPERPEDLLRVLPTFYDNLNACMGKRPLRRFLFRNRLSLFAHLNGWKIAWALLTALPWLPWVQTRVGQIARAIPTRAVPPPKKQLT
jgi:hypothetical protein